MQHFRDPRVPGIVIKFDGVSFHTFSNGQWVTSWEEDTDPAEVAKRIFDQSVESTRHMNDMIGSIGKTFGDLGVSTDIEGETLTEPSPEQISARIDELSDQIEHETDPARREELKKEALRLMAMESSASAHALVQALLEGKSAREWLRAHMPAKRPRKPARRRRA